MTVSQANATAVSPPTARYSRGIPVVVSGLLFLGGVTYVSPARAEAAPTTVDTATSGRILGDLPGYELFELGDPMPQYVPIEWINEIRGAYPLDVAPFEVTWDESD